MRERLMPRDNKKRKLVAEAFLYVLDQLDEGQNWSAVNRELEAKYQEDIWRTAYDLTQLGGFVKHGFITWQGHEYRYQKRHRFRHWWSNNWFPAIVAALTIPTGILTGAKLLMDLFG